MSETRMVPRARPTSYYGRPVVKSPPWKWSIPAYFFSGGLAAGSALLGAGAHVVGDDRLAARSEVTALAAIGASTFFLIDDLGRPERFANMLRVFKPTSPMSMGSWILAAFGPAAGAAASAGTLGILPRVRRAASFASALLAPAVATYTAVLISDTATPAWHEARRELPFVFAAGAATSAGGVALVFDGRDPTRAASRMALLGAAAERVSTRAMKRSLGELAQPYREGRARTLGRIATIATVTGAALVAAGRKRRVPASLGGALVCAGAAVERFAIFEAGRRSAQDPAATVAPQRSRLGPQ